MAKKLIVVLLIAIAAFASWPTQRAAVRVGSKQFTESVILGEMLRLLSEEEATPAQHLRELGGTRIVYEALRHGEIDAYVEYTGTLTKEIFSDRKISSDDDMRTELAKGGIVMSQSLGFNNTYAIGMQREQAERLGISKVSHLARHPSLRFGFSNEFMGRSDGWPGLQSAYGLATEQVTGLDHDIAYRQLQLGVIDVIDAYSTEARIAAFDIAVLEDDRSYFPRYEAVILYREELALKHPAVVVAMKRLENHLPADKMIAVNGQVELEGDTESAAAASFLKQSLGVSSTVVDSTTRDRITQRTLEHLELVRRSLLPAILFGVPLGVFAARRRRLGQIVLATTGIIQTIPAFALLVLLMPLAVWSGLESVGVGSVTAIVALFLYSLLPIVRGTHSGLTGIDPALLESAEVLGLSNWYRLIHIKLPLASRGILAGIKTAAVINVGFATLGALIGAGGYGQPILSGIRLASTELMLEGAIPAALLAIAVQYAFELLELAVVPKGLRLRPARQPS